MKDPNRKAYPGEEDYYNNKGKLNVKPSFGRRYTWQIAVAVLVLLLVVFASTTFFLLTRPSSSALNNTHSAPVPTRPSTQTAATVVPTATTLATTATVLPTTTAGSSGPVTSGLPCIVNIGTWTGGSPEWVVHNNILYNDGSSGANNGPTIIAPCQPNAANYVVEAKIQVTNPSGGCFGIVFRGSSTQNGWQGYKADLCGLNTAYISVYGQYDALTQAPFTPGTTTHTYRAEVKDNTIKLFIDGNLVDTATDNRLLTTETGEGVGLYSQNVQLQVTSFQVTALT